MVFKSGDKYYNTCTEGVASDEITTEVTDEMKTSAVECLLPAPPAPPAVGGRRRKSKKSKKAKKTKKSKKSKKTKKSRKH